MSDNSTVTDEEAVKTPPVIELSSITDDDARALAKRYAEQERWKLTESVRNTLATFARDPVKGLEMMDSIDPNVSKRVLKDLWVGSVEELAKKTEWLSEEKITSIIEAKLKETSVRDVKTSIETKMSQLPESIRELAKAEFTDLTEWRSLSPEKLEAMAEKAVNLARVQSGTFEKTAKLNWSSQNVSSVESPQWSDFLQNTNHPFFSKFKQ